MSSFNKISYTELAVRVSSFGQRSKWIAYITKSELQLEIINNIQSEIEIFTEKECKEVKFIKPFDVFIKDYELNINNPIVLTNLNDLTQTDWHQLDILRTKLSHHYPLIFILDEFAFFNLNLYAPNISSFLGTSVYVCGENSEFLNNEERLSRLSDLQKKYNYTNEEIIKMASSKTIPLEPYFAEWLVLLGKGHLIENS